MGEDYENVWCRTSTMPMVQYNEPNFGYLLRTVQQNHFVPLSEYIHLT